MLKPLVLRRANDGRWVVFCYPEARKGSMLPFYSARYEKFEHALEAVITALDRGWFLGYPRRPPFYVLQ